MVSREQSLGVAWKGASPSCTWGQTHDCVLTELNPLPQTVKSRYTEKAVCLHIMYVCICNLGDLTVPIPTASILGKEIQHLHELCFHVMQ